MRVGHCNEGRDSGTPAENVGDVMVVPRQEQPQEEADGAGCARRTLRESHGGICADVRHSVRGRANWHAGVRWLGAGVGDAAVA
jgi:hypothetical protein